MRERFISENGVVMVTKIPVYAYKAEDGKYHCNVPEAGNFKATTIKHIDTVSRHMIVAAGVADFFALDIRMEYDPADATK